MTSMVVCAGCPEFGQEHISVGSVPLRSYVLALDRMLLWGPVRSRPSPPLVAVKSFGAPMCHGPLWPGRTDSNRRRSTTGVDLAGLRERCHFIQVRSRSRFRGFSCLRVWWVGLDRRKDEPSLSSFLCKRVL